MPDLLKFGNVNEDGFALDLSGMISARILAVGGGGNVRRQMSSQTLSHYQENRISIDFEIA